MRETFELLRRVVASEAPVLVVGESGTGKELVARAIHAHGPRKHGPFVAQSCATLSDDVLEASLFGHVRGAFSGAIRGHEGLFGAAAGGTLFLDEVAEMSPAMQAKLLRVLSDGAYLPVGSTSPKKADVRLVSATHHDLSALVEDGRLRQDLYYRLHVIAVPLPPLRERPGDVRLLSEHFLREIEGAPARISQSAWRCLERYAWPGNVRELRAEMARWAVVCGPGLEVGPEHLSPAIRAAGGFAPARADHVENADTSAAAGTGSLESAIAELERALLVRGLERTGGNRTRLAKELVISRTTLNERLKRYGLG
jgi:two-component system response regulator HupR/HoxA